MKKPSVNYRDFRLTKLNDPSYSHLKLLLGWVVYLLFFYLTETRIPAETCHVVYCPLDDLIPFCELFLIPYVLWYGLILFSLLYFGLYNPDSFRKLSLYFIMTQLMAISAYILFPTRQDLRPESFPRSNLLISGVKLLYQLDTNTGVCPSLHVAFSLAIASVWLREPGLRLIWKCVILVLVFFICLSTMFLKQHSAVDVFAAIFICLPAEWLLYHRKRIRPVKKQT